MDVFFIYKRFLNNVSTAFASANGGNKIYPDGTETFLQSLGVVENRCCFNSYEFYKLYNCFDWRK